MEGVNPSTNAVPFSNAVTPNLPPLPPPRLPTKEGPTNSKHDGQRKESLISVIGQIQRSGRKTPPLLTLPSTEVLYKNANMKKQQRLYRCQMTPEGNFIGFKSKKGKGDEGATILLGKEGTAVNLVGEPGKDQKITVTSISEEHEFFFDSKDLAQKWLTVCF